MWDIEINRSYYSCITLFSSMSVRGAHGLCSVYATGLLFSVMYLEARYGESNLCSGLIREKRHVHHLVSISQKEKCCTLKPCQFPSTNSLITALNCVSTVVALIGFAKGIISKIGDQCSSSKY